MNTEFKEIYKDLSPRIYKLCLSYCADRSLADDLHQETWIAVWESLPKFRQESQLSTWIYRIAINTCLTGMKKHKDKNLNSEKILSKIAADESFDEHQMTILQQSIAQLREADRIIITLVLEEKPYTEIAEITGITENNLRVKIHRIKRELSEIYKKHENL